MKKAKRTYRAFASAKKSFLPAFGEKLLFGKSMVFMVAAKHLKGGAGGGVSIDLDRRN